MNILDKIQSAGYVVTDEQIEQLAQISTQGDFAGIVYLRSMVVEVQSRLGKPARGRRPARLAADNLTAQDEAISVVHERMYAHVLVGVAQGEPDLPSQERQRRATKFRTVAATLRAYVRAGNDLRTVDAMTVTKSALNKATKPASSGDRVQQRVQRAEVSILRALQALLKQNEELGLEAMDRIRNALDELEGVEQPETTEGTRADFGGQTTTHIRSAQLQRTPVAERPGAQLHRGR